MGARPSTCLVDLRNTPRQDDLAGRLSVLLGDLLNLSLVNDAALRANRVDRVQVAEGRVSLDNNALALEPLDILGLLEV